MLVLVPELELVLMLVSELTQVLVKLLTPLPVKVLAPVKAPTPVLPLRLLVTALLIWPVQAVSPLLTAHLAV